MPEMSTLLGYEIVDKKARELIESAGLGEGSLLKTIHLESGESASIKDFISGTPIIGMRMLGTTIAEGFESEETLYNPRTITSSGTSFENSTSNHVKWTAHSGSTNLSGVVLLPGVTNGFFGIPVDENYAKDYETVSGTLAGRISTKNATYYKDSKGQRWICDEANMETGVYYRRINKFVFDGSDDEIITKLSTDDNHWRYEIKLPSENLYPFNRYDNEGFICDRLPNGLASVGNNIENSGIIMTHGGFVVNIGYYMSENTVDEFRSILQQYPIAVYYVLPVVDSRSLLSNADNEARIHSYRAARYGMDTVKIYTAHAGVGQMFEFSYATNPAGLAVALGAREFERSRYESLMDKLYMHFGCDRNEYPNCMIVMPKSLSVTSYSVFRFYFHKYKISEIDYEGLNSSNDKIYIGHYGIVKVLPSDTVLPDDLNDVSAVIDFVISNFTKDDLVYYSSSSHYDADTNNYVYYSNYALSVVPVTEIDIPLDGDVKFPKASPGKNPAHGSKGQLLTSEGNGSIGFTTLPPAKTYEDILYYHFRVSKHKYPYIHMAISGDTVDAYIYFASQIEETDWCYYNMSGKYMSAAIPRTSELLSGMCYDLDRLVNYVVTNVESNALSDPVRGTYSLNSIIPYQGHYGWHYLNINVHENTMHYDLRQQPLLTTERGVRFTHGLKNGSTITPYYYGEAGQYMVTNGDGTVSFADGVGSGESGFNDVYAETAISMGRKEGTAVGNKSIAFGDSVTATGSMSVAFGYDTKATGAYSMATGYLTEATGWESHAEGYYTKASGDYSHAEGLSNTAEGYASHAEGKQNTVSGDYAHAEGYNNTASNTSAHAEGNDTTASGAQSHAEGFYTVASAWLAHAEGDHSEASGNTSHAEGNYTKASGDYSHAEGFYSEAKGYYSHAEGSYTIASGYNQHAQGKYNVEDTENKYAHIVGGGESDSERKNIHTLDWEGNAVFAGDVTDGNGDSIASVKALIANSGGATDVTVPTKVSELENDAGYITADDLTTLNTEAVYGTESKTVVVTPFTDTVIDSLTLPAGTYYIQGKFKYDGSDLRYLHRLKANGKGIANVSMYDNAGVVVSNVSGICNFESETVVEYEVYLNKNDVTECTLNYVRMDAVRAGVTVVNAPLDIAEGGAY